MCAGAHHLPSRLDAPAAGSPAAEAWWFRLRISCALVPMRETGALLGVFLLSAVLASCTRERALPSFDPAAALLDIARSACAAPRSTLQGYVADRRRHTRQYDSIRTAHSDLDTTLSHLDSDLAGYVRTGLVLDDSAIVEVLATQDQPAKYGLVSMQPLAEGAPFSHVGWIDLFFGPMDVDSATPWGRRHPGEHLFFALQIFLVSESSRWVVEVPHYYGSWLSPRNTAARQLIQTIEGGKSCQTVGPVLVHKTWRADGDGIESNEPR